MSKKIDISDALVVIRQLSGQAHTLTIPKLYARFMDGLDGGLFLNQLIFWSDKGKRPDGFIYKTREDWQGELLLSVYAIRKATKKLKDDGLLETKLHKANGAPTLHYRLDQTALLEALTRFVENDKSDLSNSANPGFVEINESITENNQTNTEHDGDGVVSEMQVAYDELVSIGVTPGKAVSLARTCAHDQIAGWVAHVRTSKGLTNGAGLVVARLNARVPAPAAAVDERCQVQDVDYCDGCGWPMPACRCDQVEALVIGLCPRCFTSITDKDKDRDCPGCREKLECLPELLPVEEVDHV